MRKRKTGSEVFEIVRWEFALASISRHMLDETCRGLAPQQIDLSRKLGDCS